MFATGDSADNQPERRTKIALEAPVRSLRSNANWWTSGRSLWMSTAITIIFAETIRADFIRSPQIPDIGSLHFGRQVLETGREDIHNADISNPLAAETAAERRSMILTRRMRPPGKIRSFWRDMERAGIHDRLQLRFSFAKFLFGVGSGRLQGRPQAWRNT